MGEDKPWKQVKAEWRDVVLVCRKCAKKLDGGFGPDGDQRLAKTLRAVLEAGTHHKVKSLRRDVAVVEVGCLDVCPKKAVVVVKGSAPDRMILVPARADMSTVLERLGLDRSRRRSPDDIA